MRPADEAARQAQLRGCSSRRGLCGGARAAPRQEEVCAAAGGRWAAVLGLSWSWHEAAADEAMLLVAPGVAVPLGHLWLL